MSERVSVREREREREREIERERKKVEDNKKELYCDNHIELAIIYHNSTGGCVVVECSCVYVV